ncbi:adenylate cyclase type 3 [Planococcus citri]|uniref:adenylate cyclase type 3 n=1 Tax=Planococcus citri TaxID=170843 RepID=UPI0031F960A6
MKPEATVPESSFVKFRDPALESLYQTYNLKQKRASTECFLFACAVYDLYALISEDHLHLQMIAFFVIDCLLWTWCKWSPKPCWKLVPVVAAQIPGIQIVCRLMFNDLVIYGNNDLGWAILFAFLLFVTLPLSLFWSVIFSLSFCAEYLTVISYLAMRTNTSHLYNKIAANFVSLLTANMLGLFAFFLFDKQQRTAFLETRQSLKMKLSIEEQSAEQERLLLSVLPGHVAVKMRQDLGSALDTQFKKIYMSRHENVSILYADIVGFTAISSTYSASELVKILNELFARFDRLSERYHQLRIKILGDCYYCISGAPRERPDHAILSVHMGLSMVDAIKYVQQTTNSPVDMRVGIHTGAVLAGVLGQRQWQFDVYSKDVELANKMESSGLPGRVHISEKTYSYLNDEFEVEPGYGEKREEALRLAGIKTFFIVKALKPFKGAQDEIQNGNIVDNSRESSVININDDMLDDSKCPPKKRSREDSDGFKLRLKKELMNRDGYKELSKHTSMFTLLFKNSAKEREYNYHNENLTSVSLIGCPIALLFTSIAQATVLPRNILSICSFGVGFFLIVIFVILSIAELFPRTFPELVVWYSTIINNSSDIRRLIAVIIVFLLTVASIVDLIPCETEAIITSDTANQTMIDDIDKMCLYPSYFTHFCVLILIAVTLIAHLSHIVKASLLLVIAASHCIVTMFLIRECIIFEQFRSPSYESWHKPATFELSLLLLGVSNSLAFLGRHMEKASRVLFLWRTEVEEQREKASDIGRRNEALVYNILPKHVAIHFMQCKRQHEELYSQSYAEVGVLFASMPNFSDFYSEETVNNQGLECLRFLNEVISDFDALLEYPQFQDNIIKIKTIGSTYMAASGLNPSRIVRPDDPIEIRWAHLALLVEFALELKKALQSINEQSFNHFVLKMGINHGPITAGVIGARKPHYDIWGNSVNVASRMESTGKAGCIQVTEETCTILQHFGYKFEQRGLVAVKGKGQLMTYYLIGKGCPHPIPPPLMETVREEEEEDDDDDQNNNETRNTEQDALLSKEEEEQNK